MKPVETQNLTISPQEVAYWMGEIQASEDFQRKEFLDRMGYENLIKLYEGDQNPVENSPYSITQMDEIYPGVSSIISNTYYQDPSMNVIAKHPDAEKPIELPLAFQLSRQSTGAPLPNTGATYSDLMRDAMKYAVKKHGLKPEAQMALFDLIAAGFCVIECNHMTIREAGEQQAEAEQPSLPGMLDKAIESIERFVTGKTDEAAQTADQVAEKVAKETDSQGRDYILDSTYIERWNPVDILFDYRAKVFKKSRFIAKRVEMTIAEFNTTFPTFKGKIPANEKRSLLYSKHSDKSHSECAVVYEVQIKKKSGVCVLKLARGIKEALEYYPLPFTTNGFTLKYGSLDKYGKLYPVSRLYRASKPQKELNHHLTIQTEHADRSMKKVAVFMNGLNNAGKAQIKDPDIYGIVEKQVATPVFEPFPSGGVAPENESLQMKMVESVNKQLGTNELAKSGQSDSEFATQDQLKAESFAENTNSVKDALADVLREVLGTLKDIIMQMWDGEDIFKVTGKHGGEFWYTPEMGKLSDILIGDYDIDVDIVSAERPNPMRDRNEALEIWRLLSLPETQMFLQSKGKQVSLAAFDNVLKRYNTSLDSVTEDAAPMGPMPMDPQAAPPVDGLPPDPAAPPMPPQEEELSGAAL